MKDAMAGEAELIRQAMRLLRRRPRRHQQRVCVVCGTAFSSERSSRRYCSNRCAVRAFRARQRQQRASGAAPGAPG
jgi:predicted nucleic acid-binding Zn ribbon protein